MPTQKENDGAIGRSAKSGQFVSLEEAKRNPNTTVVENAPRTKK